MLFSYLLEIYQMDLRRNSRKDVIFFFVFFCFGGGGGTWEQNINN